MVKSNVHLAGSDMYSTILKQADNVGILYPGIIGIVDQSNVTISDLTVDGNTAHNPLVNGSSWPPKGNGITFRNDNNDKGHIRIYNVRVLNVACYGIKTHFGKDIVINNVYIENAWWDCINFASSYSSISNIVCTDWGDVGVALLDAKKRSLKIPFFMMLWNLLEVEVQAYSGLPLKDIVAPNILS